MCTAFGPGESSCRMPPTDQLETVGGRYHLGERLGEGGMGEVFVAHDLRLEREVALKLLRADLARRDGMRARVVAEARLAARLTHPNVVAVLDTGEHEGRPFVVMERLSGRTLRDELGEGPMSAERARDVGLQVLRALAAAHELGIVHRDVKPGNVLDAGVGTWKVADFGIAKWIHADETLTGTGELLGSPSYLAPERITGAQAGPASDLYAVGVLLYEAVRGRRPFEGRYASPTSANPDVDRSIAAVIERAMRLDPAKRFPDAETMAAALLGEADASPADRTEVLPTTPTEPADADGSSQDLEATAVVPPMDRTARLPEITRTPRPSRATRTRRPARGTLIAAAAILAMVLVVVLSVVVFTGASGPNTAPRTTSLPPPLEDALSQLEDAVQP
jgi:serine/threonine protein kinase